MNDPAAMGMIERRGDLLSIAQHAGDGHSAFADVLGKRPPFHVLHGDEQFPLLFADFVNGADVGVIQGGCGTGLLAQALFAARVVNNLRG